MFDVEQMSFKVNNNVYTRDYKENLINFIYYEDMFNINNIDNEINLKKYIINDIYLKMDDYNIVIDCLNINCIYNTSKNISMFLYENYCLNLYENISNCKNEKSFFDTMLKI